jgi:hypothetical protein
VFIQNISSIFKRLFASIFYSNVAYVSYMLQEYVPMISNVSVLCYGKCFQVVSRKLQVFYLNVAYVSHICFKCMFQIFYLLQTYVAFKCFMFHRCAQRVIGARRTRRVGCPRMGRARGQRRHAWCT